MGNLYTITPTEQQARDLEAKASQHMQEAGFTVHLNVTQAEVRSTAEICITSIEACPSARRDEPQQLLMRGILLNGETPERRVTTVYTPIHTIGMYTKAGSGYVIIDNDASLDAEKALSLVAITGRMMSTYITHRIPSIDQQMCDLHAEAQQVFLADNPDKLDALRKNGPR